MPLTHFLGLIVLVILAAGATLWLAFWTGVPLAALGLCGAVGQPDPDLDPRQPVGGSVAMDDLTLSETGLPPARAGRILLIACGALAHEILALKAANGWDHLDLQCLPAKLHLWPDRITPAVEAAVARGAGSL